MGTAAHRRCWRFCMAVLAVVWPLVCPPPWEAGHTVLGRLPAFALGVWFGTLLKKNALPSYRLYIGLAVCPLFVGGRSAASGRAVGAGVGAVLGSLCRRQARTPPLCPALRRLAGWCYGVYLVHHVLLTLVFLPFVAGHGLPLAGMFPVYLAASFVPAAVLTAMSRPVSKAVKNWHKIGRTAFHGCASVLCIHIKADSVSAPACLPMARLRGHFPLTAAPAKLPAAAG